MPMPEEQCTLKAGASLAGRGLHTGEPCRITLLPAGPDTGVVFRAPDGEIPALAANVIGTKRGTSLGKDGAEVHTVEHLLAALAGLGIDNAVIEVEGGEVPAADGSALPFVELIESAGIQRQNAEAKVIRLSVPIWTDDVGRWAVALPSEVLRISAFIAFANRMIGEQIHGFRADPDTFKREIAPARTFCTADEIDALRAQGLGKGGEENNVIVVYEDKYSIPLRFRDEFVRHKLLDLIGDLSLVGGRLHADVVTIKTSHALNVALASKIANTG